jgi:NACalpha-BTF3-like transcription factor
MAAGILAVGMLAWAAMTWVRGGEEVEKWRTRLAEQEAELKTTRDELTAQGLRSQAFQKSMNAIPDSVRQVSGIEMTAAARQYDKTIKVLQVTERDIKLAMTRSKRKEAEALAARKAKALPIATAGAGACLVASLVALVSRRRDAA